MKAGWEKGSIGDVAIVIAGQSPEGKYYNSESEGLPFYQGKKEFGHKFIGAPSVWTVKTTKIAAKGDILMSVRAPVGPVNFATQECCIGRGLAAIRSKRNFDSNFLYYYLISKEEEICGNEGAVFASINKKEIEGLSVPLPPLPEQQRIVAILDQAFDGIATAKSNVEKNLKNAREIFKSHLNAVFTHSGEGWVETNLAKEVDLLTGFAFKSKEYTDATDGIKLLRGDNIIQGVFRWEDVKKWPKFDADTYAKFSLAENDIVLAMDRTWVKAGLKYAQISQSDLPCLLVQRVARIRTKEGLDSTFLKHLIGSNEFTRYVLAIQTGLGVPHISGKQIMDFTFSKPTVAIQKDLANKIGELQAQIQRLDSIYQQKLAALDELKKSLLHQAFTGELTTLPNKQLDEALT